jgi:hypothetical protein
VASGCDPWTIRFTLGHATTITFSPRLRHLRKPTSLRTRATTAVSLFQAYHSVANDPLVQRINIFVSYLTTLVSFSEYITYDLMSAWLINKELERIHYEIIESNIRFAKIRHFSTRTQTNRENSPHSLSQCRNRTLCVCKYTLSAHISFTYKK